MNKNTNANPKVYYSETRNIVEMKLKMLNEGIEFPRNSFFYNLFNKDNDEIENYFKLVSKRKVTENEKKEALFFVDCNLQSTKLSYREISLGSEWNEAKEWLLFFWKLGEYLEKSNENISIFISYISTEIPALLISLAIIDTRYKNFSKEYINSEVSHDFEIGDHISYLNDSKKKEWHEAEIIGIENKKNAEKKFNPYLKIKTFGSKKETTSEIEIPRTIWEKKIRKGGKVKGVGGRGTQVKVNDVISEIISDRYGNSVTERLRVTPRCHVNLIGRKVNLWYRSMRESIQFSDNLGSFLLTDLLYLDNDDESNFINVHVISSEKTNVKVDNTTISIFVGSKAALDFGESSTNKNIYLTSREKVNLVEDNNILINTLRQQTILTDKDKKKKEEDIRLYFGNEGVEIPKGVEFSVF